MAFFTLRFLAIQLVVCGFSSPSLLSKRTPRFVDAVNLLLRHALVGTFTYTQLWAPATSTSFKGKGSAAHVEMLLMRGLLVLHYLALLLLSRRFTFCLSRYISLRVPSLVTLAPVVTYASLMLVHAVVWQNPLQSWHQAPIMFIYLSMQCCVAIVALQTALLEIFADKAREINALLDAAPSHVFDLENILNAAVRERALLNEEVAEVIGNVGPVVFMTAITLCIRLSFVVFVNFASTYAVLAENSSFSSSLLILYARTITKAILLGRVANCGQRLKDEVSKGEHLLDEIATSNYYLPNKIHNQLGKCRQVFKLDKLDLSMWGFVNLDHSILSTMVNLIFSLVMILVQVYVSERVASA